MDLPLNRIVSLLSSMICVNRLLTSTRLGVSSKEVQRGSSRANGTPLEGVNSRTCPFGLERFGGFPQNGPYRFRRPLRLAMPRLAQTVRDPVITVLADR